MPLYNFVCSASGKRVRRVLPAGDQEKSQSCACGSALKRNAVAPSTQTMEVLDNGLMTRRVERLVNAETMARERAQNDPRMKAPQ
jgi:hypothetical protein